MRNRRALIRTGMPSARAVGKRLGIPPKRVARLIRLMDEIRKGR